MKLRFVFDRRHVATATRIAPIELKIYFKHGYAKIIPTGIKVYLGEWNNMVVNRKDSQTLNRELSAIKKKYENVLYSMEAEGIDVDLENFNNCTSVNKNKPDSFLDFMHEEIDKNNIRESTKRQHYVAYDALLRFGGIKSFASLTIKNIELFDNFIRDEEKRTQTTIHGYHKKIKPYVAKAYKLGYIDANPYNKFTDVRGKSKERNPLMQEELDKLEAIKLPERLEKTRDLFIFSCYTGLAYADLKVFDYEKEVVESNGMKFIDGHRFKTGTEFYTPILPPAMKVLEKYHLKLPRISNQKYNDYLHIIEARLGLNKPLTSHVARHTFATTVALAHDVPIETVSKMLGHKDIKTTQIYAKVLKSTIERNVMQKML
jgi:integrase/recombinase XerD